MAPGTTYRDYLTLGLRLIIIILPLVPVIAMVIVFMATDDGTRPWGYAVLALLFGGTIAGTLWMHAFITFRGNAVRVGFMPMFWQTIPYREIAAVDAIEVDPMRDYSGWGNKGRSTQPNGMLFSGGAQWHSYHIARRSAVHRDVAGTGGRHRHRPPGPDGAGRTLPRGRVELRSGVCHTRFSTPAAPSGPTLFGVGPYRR